MEKPSTQESTVSPASRANEQTPEEELYPRLSINSSATTNKTMPNIPQRNLVHSTSPQNQCAKHSAGQNASTPTLEQTTGNHTPTMGMDGNTPHKDEGTQILSQEIHTTTITQGTQIPSQQWEQTTTAKDHETEQSTTNRLDTISQNPRIPGNLRKATHTTPRTGHRHHRYNRITSKDIHTLKTRHHTKGPRSHPDGGYENEKGRHKNTLGPHQ